MHLLEAGIQPTFSHLTLVRGSMEASVTARWLLGGVTSSDRVARATAFLWSDYEERRKAEKVLGVTKVTAPAKTAAQRRADLEAQRLADHIPAINLPPFTMLFADHGIPGGDPSEAVYRILSAYAHGRRWRLLMTPASKIGASATGQTLMRVTASDWVSEAMTELAVDWAEKAIEEAEAYIS